MELVWIIEPFYKYFRNEITAAVIGLISAGDLHLERFKVLQSSYPFYQGQGFGFSHLMIHQAIIRNVGRYLKTLDRRTTQLKGVTLLRTSH